MSSRHPPAAMGRRAHDVVVQSLPEATHPLGEEAAELPRARLLRCRASDLAAAYGIGSKPSDRLAAARAALRALQDAQEGDNLPSPQEDLAALKSQTTLAQGSAGGYGRDRAIVTKQQPGSMGGLQPRQPFTLADASTAAYFAERLAPTKPRTSSDVHRAADALAAKDPTIRAAYLQRAKTLAVPEHLMEPVHRELARLDPADPHRLGKAMRAAVARAPKAHLPLYGSAAR